MSKSVKNIVNVKLKICYFYFYMKEEIHEKNTLGFKSDI